MGSVIMPINFSVCHMFAFPFQFSLPNPNTCPNCSHTPFQHPAIAEESDEWLLLCGRPVLTVLGVSPDLFWSVRLSGFDETKGGRENHFQQNREGKDLEEERSCDCHVVSCEARRCGVWGSPRAHLQQCCLACSCRRQISFLTTEGRASCLHAWKESSGSSPYMLLFKLVSGALW